MESSQTLYRFACPRCAGTLKAPVQWAGRRGVCPRCQNALVFPETALAEGAAKTAQMIMHLVSESEAPLLGMQADKLAMHLSQGICRHFAMANELLGERPQPVRQWRRMLKLAAAREAVRLSLSTAMEQALATGQTGAAATLAAGDLREDSLDFSAPAWQVIVRYQDYLLHHVCRHCRHDWSGSKCMYRSFGEFVKVRQVSPELLEKWQRVCQHVFGFAEPAASGA